jgi:prefoldin subunit 5
MLRVGLQKNIAVYLFMALLCVQTLSIVTPVYGWLQRTIHRDFHWTYGWLDYRWSLDIPVDYYIAYAVIPLSERLREGGRLYGTFVTTDDPYLRGIANALKSAADRDGYGYYDTANFILAFVQSLPYIPDDVSTPYDEFPKFPLETLIEGGGDCEDTSLLYATLLKIIGYNVILISPPGHMMVGVAEYGGPPPTNAWYVEINGVKYYLAETTGEGWRVGDAPDIARGVTVYLVMITGEQLRPHPVDIPKLIEENKVLQRKYDELYQNYQDLSEEYNEIKQAYKTLSIDYASLKNSYDYLQSSYQALSSEYAALESSFNLLQIQHSRLQANYTSLHTEYNRINNLLQELDTKYQLLRGQYDELTQRHQKVLSELSTTTLMLNIYRFAFFSVIVIIIAITILMIFGKRAKTTPLK